MTKLDDCEGKPFTDYRHKWKSEDFTQRGYDFRMKKFKCTKCGIVKYTAPRPPSRMLRRSKEKSVVLAS